MSPDQAAAVFADMAAQRAQELAGDDRHYRLRKACVARAVDLYEALRFETGLVENGWTNKSVDQLLKEIEHASE